MVARSARSIAASVSCVYARPTLQGRKLLAPGVQALRFARDLLRVDRVGLDARAAVGFQIAAGFQPGLRVLNFDLQALPGARLMRNGTQGLEGGTLLLNFKGGRVAELGQRVGRLLADETVEARLLQCDVLDVRLFAHEQVLGRRQVRELERCQLRGVVRLFLAELLLELRAAPKPAVDLVATELSDALEVERRPPLPDRVHGEGQAEQDRDDDTGGHREREYRAPSAIAAAATAATAPTESTMASSAQRFQVGSGILSSKSTSTASPRLAFRAAMSRSRSAAAPRAA